jgi:hypothetical protein
MRGDRAKKEDVSTWEETREEWTEADRVPAYRHDVVARRSAHGSIDRVGVFSLFPTRYSLLVTPYSILHTHYSLLLPAPYSLLTYSLLRAVFESEWH